MIQEEELKKREYTKYKEYQERFEYVLKIAEDPEQLGKMTIQQLLNSYAKVEQMYIMRTEFRKKWYTPENWDQGHQQFIDYLLNVMNTYERTLSERFNQITSQRVLQKLSTISLQEQQSVELPDPEPPVLSELKHSLNRIQQNSKRRKEEEQNVWRTQIPKLISEREQAAIKAMNFLLVVSNIFSKFKPGITEAETLHVLGYIFGVIGILKKTSLMIPDNISNVSNIQGLNYEGVLYPLTFTEFIPQIIGLDMSNNLRIIIDLTALPNFDKLIETILYIVNLDRMYKIIKSIQMGYILFIPETDMIPAGYIKYILALKPKGELFTILMARKR